MVIGFWNIDNKAKKAKIDKSESLIDFVSEQQIDILILAEAGENTILGFLKKAAFTIKNSTFNQLSSGVTNITVLSRYPISYFNNKSTLYKSTRWLIYHIEIPHIIHFNLASVHFHSKLNWAKESLALECVNFSRDIAIVEEQTKCYETILIGDFNMNPFEDGLIAANGLNAIQDLAYVSDRPKGRNIDGIDYSYFYNPMWNFFGDHAKPYGTHYCRPSGHISQEWNIYDQVMFRESVKKYLEKDYVTIIDNIGGEKLTKAFERPDKELYSDHLPIIFKLKL
jgi:hypothetical protein